MNRLIANKRELGISNAWHALERETSDNNQVNVESMGQSLAKLSRERFDDRWRCTVNKEFVPYVRKACWEAAKHFKNECEVQLVHPILPTGHYGYAIFLLLCEAFKKDEIEVVWLTKLPYTYRFEWTDWQLPNLEEPEIKEPEIKEPGVDKLKELIEQRVEELVAVELCLTWNETLVDFAAAGNVHGVTYALGKGASAIQSAFEKAVANEQHQVIDILTVFGKVKDAAVNMKAEEK